MSMREGWSIPDVGLESVKRPCEGEVRRVEREDSPRVRLNCGEDGPDERK